MKISSLTLCAAALCCGLTAVSGEISMRLAASAPEKKAVNDFCAAYEKVTGKTFASSPYKLYVGKAASRAKWFKKPADLKAEEWCIESSGNEFVITGDPAGTVWGIYEFVEKYLGYHYLADDTDYFVKNPAWQLPELKERFKPAIRMREMYMAWPVVTGSTFTLRRKINWGNGYGETQPMYGSPARSHTIPLYAKKFPKNAKFVDPVGKRHICKSDPDNIKYTVDVLREFIKADRAKSKVPPLVYDISQDDGGSGYCTCANCKKLIEEIGVSGIYMTFISKVAEAIEKEYPDIYINTLAYHYTQTPPKKPIKVHPKVIVQSCNSNIISPLLPGKPNGEVMKKWAEHASLLAIWSYWRTYEGSDTYPYTRNRKEMQEELQFCRDINVFRYFAENENNIERSFYMLQYYLFSKLAVDPDIDVDKATDIFMKGYYGAAAEPMKKYLEYMETRQAERIWVEASTSLTMEFFHDNEFYTKVNKFLDEAEALVKDDPRSLQHVHWERLPVDASLLRKQAKFRKIIKDKTALLQRWKNNKLEFLNQKYVRWHNTIPKSGAINKLQMDEEIFKAMPFAIPEQFKGKKIVDLHWMDFSPWSQYKNNLVEDPEAASGKAWEVGRNFDPTKWKKPKHYLPFAYGVWNSTAPAAQRRVIDRTIEGKDIPQDEKYHWIKVGKFPMTKDSFLHLHWSWTIVCYFRKAITGIIQDNPKEVWMSVKFTGPTYVKGSTKPDNVYLERVIVINE